MTERVLGSESVCVEECVLGSECVCAEECVCGPGEEKGADTRREKEGRGGLAGLLAAHTHTHN